MLEKMDVFGAIADYDERDKEVILHIKSFRQNKKLK